MLDIAQSLVWMYLLQSMLWECLSKSVIIGRLLPCCGRYVVATKISIIDINNRSNFRYRKILSIFFRAILHSLRQRDHWYTCRKCMAFAISTTVGRRYHMKGFWRLEAEKYHGWIPANASTDYSRCCRRWKMLSNCKIVMSAQTSPDKQKNLCNIDKISSRYVPN
jgi:hypothetical protein